MAIAVPPSGAPAASPLRWTGGGGVAAPNFRASSEIASFAAFPEPFLGGASAFLGLRQFPKAFLRDSNAELIATFGAVTDHPVGGSATKHLFTNLDVSSR